MIRIEIEVETDDPALRDYVLGDVESWRKTPAKVTVSTREEDAWTGGATVHVSTSTSMSVGTVEESIEEEPPHSAGRIAPPQRTTVPDARDLVDFPVWDVPSLSSPSPARAILQPGGQDVPPSVVIVHIVHDERGRHRGNVWVTSSAALLPCSKFESWRTVGDYDVCADRSGGYYRCKIRTQRDSGFVQIESTAHRSLDDVLDLAGTIRAL